jgi:Ni,Fe-hydrogenase III small subunit
VGIIADFLTRIAVKALTKSPWALHFNSGSCNGCDIEIIAALTPRYDVERFGIVLQGSPRHADVLLATGPVTRQAEPHLREVYEQMPWPKFVFAIGQCAISGAVYEQTYNHCGGIDEVIPVSCYIPGCPPRPEEIVYGFCKHFAHLQGALAKEKIPLKKQILKRKMQHRLLGLLRRS